MRASQGACPGGRTDRLTADGPRPPRSADGCRFEVLNLTRGTALASRAERAGDPVRRAVGLIGRDGWRASDGIILDPCGAIHTFFMRLTVDVVFVDSDGRVLRAERGVRPWRIGPCAWRARWALEVPAGTLECAATAAGDELLVRRLGTSPTPRRP